MLHRLAASSTPSISLYLTSASQIKKSQSYRCPFRPPSPALAQARGDLLIFVQGRPGTIIYRPRARVMLAHGLGAGPSPGLSCRFGLG
jgi:hypothetical protein